VGTNTIPEWEYKIVSPVEHRLDATETLVIGHRFGYTKRRRYKTETKFTGFQPYCSCKWKSKIWFRSKFLAQMQHHEHSKAFTERQPSLFEIARNNEGKS